MVPVSPQLHQQPFVSQHFLCPPFFSGSSPSAMLVSPLFSACFYHERIFNFSDTFLAMTCGFLLHSAHVYCIEGLSSWGHVCIPGGRSGLVLGWISSHFGISDHRTIGLSIVFPSCVVSTSLWYRVMLAS